MRASRRWIQIPGRGLVEVDPRPRARKPVAPSIRADSIKPYRNTYTGEVVESRTQHRRILKENGLIELGNEFDAWQREVRNPDFDDDGRQVWRDPLSEADESIYGENSEWIQKQAT